MVIAWARVHGGISGSGKAMQDKLERPLWEEQFIETRLRGVLPCVAHVFKHTIVLTMYRVMQSACFLGFHPLHILMSLWCASVRQALSS